MNKTAVRDIPRVSISALTDTGRVRPHNEDNFIVCADLDKNLWVLKEGWTNLSKAGCLLVLADGMGGANAGEIASSIAVESLKEQFSTLAQQVFDSDSACKEILLKGVSIAHERIVAKAKSDAGYEGMGTTIVVAWATHGKLYVCWCGDSRAYKFNAATGLRPITKDHSLVWELVEAGKLTPDEADVHPDNNIITQSLGDTGTTPRPDVVVENLEDGDVILLCSDGLNNMIDSAAIEKTLRGTQSPTAMSRQLIRMANEHGGKDNITVILLRASVPGAVPATPKKRSNRLVYVVPIVLALFVLALIALTREGRGRTSMEGNASATSLAIDSVTTEGNHEEVRSSERSGTTPARSKKVKDTSSTIEVLPTDRDEDTLHFIAASMVKLKEIRHQWDSLKRTVDSLRQSTEIEGSTMMTVNDQVSEFERLIAVEKLERFLAEWRSYEQNSAKGLSTRFTVADLERKTDKLHEKITSLDKALRHVKLNDVQ